MAQTKAQRSAAAKKAAATRKRKQAASDSSSRTVPTQSQSGIPISPGGSVLGANDRRADDQAVIGHFAEVVSGEHKGAYGTAEFAVTVDGSGEPDDVAFRTRDSGTALLTVKYSDLRPAEAGRR